MRFCFYSDFRDLKGGYATLLITLIRELYNQKQEVLLFNFTNGLIANELKKENIPVNIIDLEFFNWKDAGEIINHTDIFVVPQFMEPYKHLFKINPRFIYFDINDFISQISNYKYGLKFPFLGKKLVTKLLAKNSLLFMDDTGKFNLQRDFDITVADPVFLPIPVVTSAENVYLKRNEKTNDTLNLTYIGRSVDWKMMPLKKILQDCAAAATNKNIIISIVVDSHSELKKYINTDNYNSNSKITIDVQENMLPSDINDFLLQKSDIHFAMGTAALEAAKLGVPTILVDSSTKEFPADYRYKWLYQTTGYSLGKNLDKINVSHETSMQELLAQLAGDKEKMREHSKKSFMYVLQNHSAPNIARQLITISRHAKFRIADARYLVPYYLKVHTFIKTATDLLMRVKKALRK